MIYISRLTGSMFVKHSGTIYLAVISALVFTGCILSKAYRDYYMENRIKYSDTCTVSQGFGGNSGIIELDNTVIIIESQSKF